MSEPASTASPSVLQQLVQQLTAPLQEAAKVAAAKLTEPLAKQVEQTTKAFNDAHPAVSRATGDLVGWAAAIAKPTGAVAAMTGSITGMIRNTRDMRQEISKVLDGFPALDGIRLRFMMAGDAIRKLNIETVKATATNIRATVATKAAAVAAKVSEIATKAWAVAQGVLNAVMRLNPLGLIITGIMILVGLFVLAYKRSDTFRSIVQRAMRGVQTAIGWVMKAAKVVFDWIRNHWKLLLGILTGPIGLAVLLITRNWDRIKAGVTAVRDWITRTWNGLVSFFTGLPGRLAGAASRMWDAFRTAARDAINFVIDAWNRLDLGIHISVPAVMGVGGFRFDVDDIIPDIPRLAEGGLVRSRPGGVLALLGEGREDELVVPLSRVRALGGLAGRPVTVNVYPRPGQSEYEIGRIAARELAWAAKQ